MAWMQGQQKIAKGFYMLAIANFLYKLYCAIAISTMPDLLGRCYLKVNFKTWIQVINVLEIFIFFFCVYRIKNVNNILF